MKIRKVKLNYNVKSLKSSKLQSYIEGEIQYLHELINDEWADSFEPDDLGVSFKDRFKAFLDSPMKKGDEVDSDVLSNFISEIENRADIDMNGQDDWETEEDEEYLYYKGGEYFLMVSKKLLKLLTREEWV